MFETPLGQLVLVKAGRTQINICYGLLRVVKLMQRPRLARGRGGAAALVCLAAGKGPDIQRVVLVTGAAYVSWAIRM